MEANAEALREAHAAPARSARWWRAVVAFVAAAMLGYLAWDSERTLLRSIECMRPGRCIVTRGADWVGRRVALEVDADRYQRVEVRPSGGQNPSQVLVLSTLGESEYELMRGPDAPALAEQLQPFFELRSEATLSLRPPVARGERIVSLGMAAAAILVFGVLVLDSLRAATLSRRVDRDRGARRRSHRSSRGS